MKAIGKYVIITPVKDKDTVTKGGLILAEKQREDIRYRKAEVIKVGSEVSAIKENDKIYYDKAAGFNIEIDKEEFKVIKEFDVVVIL
tara:strand:- start:507 stop:767 length:261 start_codon:yes stop_codon:yes gene_type:complete